MNWSVLKGHCGGRRHVWLLLGLLSAAIPLAAAILSRRPPALYLQQGGGKRPHRHGSEERKNGQKGAAQRVGQ